MSPRSRPREKGDPPTDSTCPECGNPQDRHEDGCSAADGTDD